MRKDLEPGRDRLHAPFRSILPPHILEKIVERGTPAQRRLAMQTLRFAERLRGMRMTFAEVSTPTLAGEKRRTVYDAEQRELLPGKLVRGEHDGPTGDESVNEAFDGLGDTYDFLAKVLGRNSIDDRGMRLDATVHYGVGYGNAFWDGRQMVFGDGDGEIFNSFTDCLDVIGHEITHGVIDAEAALVYWDQPGALNESFADVFGTLVLQAKKDQTVDQASWLIGEGLFTAKIANGKALRSVSDPGTAYGPDDLIGSDPQPGHMRQYVDTAEDNGGVHINSGIPNRAFYLAAMKLGDRAWKKAGPIWYHALCHGLNRRSDFAEAAWATAASANALFGPDEEQAVLAAWREVGVERARVRHAA